jgi:hypothetical protein
MIAVGIFHPFASAAVQSSANASIGALAQEAERPFPPDGPGKRRVAHEREQLQARDVQLRVRSG